MANTLKYKRVLLKLSGEMFQGEKGWGIDFNVAREMAREIATLRDRGAKVAVVIGAGNMFRGREVRNKYLDRNTADYMGMIATVINAMALRGTLASFEVEAPILSAIHIPQVADAYTIEAAARAMQAGQVVLLAGGTGNPYFTTDTAVVLRALELNADVVLKATKVDGVYDKDPVKYPSARKYDSLTFQEALEKRLKVMDATAFALCANNRLPILVFRFKRGALEKVVMGETIGTTIHD